jgi:hypothetical protein
MDAQREAIPQSQLVRSEMAVTLANTTLQQLTQEVKSLDQESGLDSDNEHAAAGRVEASLPVAVNRNINTAKQTAWAVQSFKKWVDWHSDRRDAANTLSSHAIEDLPVNCCCVSVLPGSAVVEDCCSRAMCYHRSVFVPCC